MSRKEDHQVDQDNGGAVPPGPVSARRLGPGETSFETPFEHWMLSGSTTGVLASDYLIAMGVWDDVPSIRAHATKRLLTVLTQNSVNAERSHYSLAEQDPARVYTTREGVFIQGSIPCFADLVGLNRKGMAVRVFLANMADKETGETTDEWRVQLVKSRKDDSTGKLVPVPLEEQEIVMGEELNNLRLMTGRAEVYLELDPVNPDERSKGYRWLHMRDGKIPDDDTLPTA